MKKETITIEIEEDMLKDIDNLIKKREYKNREEFIIESIKEFIEIRKEDKYKLNDKTIKSINEARKRMDNGNFLTEEDIKKKFEL